MFQCENIEREYIREKKQAAIEFEVTLLFYIIDELLFLRNKLYLVRVLCDIFGYICSCLLCLQERKTQLKENLIQELEDKKKQVEFERNTMELMGGRIELIGRCGGAHMYNAAHRRYDGALEWCDEGPRRYDGTMKSMMELIRGMIDVMRGMKEVMEIRSCVTYICVLNYINNII